MGIKRVENRCPSSDVTTEPLRTGALCCMIKILETLSAGTSSDNDDAKSQPMCMCMRSVTLNSLADHSRKGSVRLSSCVNCKEGEFALARHSLTQGRQRYNMWLITSLSAIAAWSRGCAVPVHLLCSCWESLCLSCCRLLISCVPCMCNKYHHHNMNVLAKALHCSSFMHGNPSLSSL